MIYEKIAEDNSAYLLGMPQTVIAEKQEIEDSLSWYENLIGEKNNNEGSKTIEKVAFFKC